MANNILSNGRIQQNTNVSQRLRNDRTKKVPEIPAIESNNWLLHRHYTRHEYKTCKILIDHELKKSNEHNEYANYLKGLILRREGKVQDSLNCFQAAYNVNSTNINNVKQIAKSFLIMGSHKRAIEAYLEAEKISNVPDWEIYLNLGECYTKLNQLADAKKHLRRSIELTKNELPYIALAKVCLLEDQVTEARSAYTAALSANPESVEAATQLGLLYLKIDDIQRAFQQFGTALAHSPNCAKAILPIAYVIQNHQEYDVALSKYKVAAQSIPESCALWNNVGMCFYGKQKFVAPIIQGEWFDEQNQATNVIKYFHGYNGEFVKGFECPRRRPCTRPGKPSCWEQNFLNPPCHYSIGRGYLLADRDSEVKWIKLKLSFSYLVVDKGHESGTISLALRKKMAISCLKRAHYLNPLAFLPASNLGMVFLTTGQPASAAIYLCAAVNADPKNPLPYLLLGLALKRLDDLEGAEKVLQKAHALSPQDPLILINYAIVLDAQGKGDIAAEFLTAINDITAVIDVDEEITQTAKKLSAKLHQQKTVDNEQDTTRVLSSDEV